MSCFIFILINRSTDCLFFSVSYVFYLGYGFVWDGANTNQTIQNAPKTTDDSKDIHTSKQTLYGVFPPLSGTTADIE